VKDYTYIIQI